MHDVNMGGLTTAERDAVERAKAAPMLGQVERWSRINSGSRNLAGLAAMEAELTAAFAPLPGAMQSLDPAPVEIIDASGAMVDLPHGRNLLLTVRPDAPLQILLTGHYDTVFPADHAFQSPHWREPGILNGPGVADMKGGIAVMLAALLAVEGHADADRIGYAVVLNADEEVGSPASAPLIAMAARGKQAAFTFEPAALPDGTLAGARPGSGNFTFTVRGRSAHAGRNPEDGRNAIVAAADLALRLAQLRRDGLSVNVARIEGGSPNTVVPDLALLRVNLRPASEEQQAAVEAGIADAVRAASAAHDVTIERHGHFARPPKPLDNRSQALFALVREAGRDLGQTITWQPSGGVCDGNNIAACGVPVIDTMGVRGGAIHSPDEYLIVDSLGERAALAALSILRLVKA